MAKGAPGAAHSAPAARKRRARGRPKTTGAEDVRDALLNAAKDLFIRYGYRAVSSRQIAATAGANVAMIRYYFGGKPGLYKEMLQSVVQPIVSRFTSMIDSGAAVGVDDMIANQVRTVSSNPWLMGVVLREVLTPEGPLRAIFKREAPEKFIPIAERIIRGQIEQGRIRDDLDPNLIVLSLLSLTIFPFLALPLTSQLFGVRTDEEFQQKFLRHTGELLARGLKGKKE